MLQPYTHEIITDTRGKIATLTNLQMNDINTFKEKYPFNYGIKAEEALSRHFDFLGFHDSENLKVHFYESDRLEHKKVISHIFRFIEKDLNKQESLDKRNPDSAFLNLMPADLVTGLLDAWYPHLRDRGIAARF